MPTNIQTIKNFPQLIKYLRTELGWPVDEEDADNLTFDYDPDELGLDKETAVKVRAAKQLRPLVSGQPWGIFWIDFEPKKLPVTIMRRILNQLVSKKRGGKSQQATWNLDDLLFISAVGSEKSDGREITFAHFHQEEGDLPTLRVLGWDGADTVLKIDYVAKTLKEKLLWPQNPKDVVRWRETWAEAFKHKPGHVIKTADALAARLAELARNIRAAAETIMAHETERGRLRKLHKAFQTALIHDLSEEDFADTYAQTITYGLLTAAISRTDMSGGMGTALVAENITDMVPVTNPFLKEMLQTFLQAGGRNRSGVDFDELGIQDVVELLRSDETDLPAILRDFNNRAEGEDPVIRFYEDFLAAYDKALKVQRGVFYTPKPVVSYIVRGVHELLQSEFGLEDGLADTSTWDALRLRSGLTIPKGVDPKSFFVTILDPATGTATFLVEVIDVVHKTMTAKWKKQGKNAAQIQAAWNEYVPQSLLPRLYGYELMMAPYAIAHMKIGLKLYETGYRFASDQRANIYLTNALEEPSQLAEGSAASLFEALGHESQAVNEVKRGVRFTVVIGNPPYSNLSANLNPSARAIIEKYKFIDGQPVKERNALQLERNLNDDYVKFIGWSEDQVAKTGLGILSMISNNVYTWSPSLRGMRAHLLKTFNQLYVLNLHGASQRGPSDIRSNDDQNVFDIEQPVAIGIFCLTTKKATSIEYSDISGNRIYKYGLLSERTYSNLNFERISPNPPQWQFLPVKSSGEGGYDSFLHLPDILPLYAEGIKTGRDWLVVDFDREPIAERMNDIRKSKESDDALCKRIGLNRKKAWNFRKARINLQDVSPQKQITKVSFRAFDDRYIFYHSDWIASPSLPVMRNFSNPKKLTEQKRNIAILAGRISRDKNSLLYWCASKIADKGMLSSLDNVSVFPALIYPAEFEGGFDFGETAPEPNFSKEFIAELESRLHLTKPAKSEALIDWTFEVISYIYAILWSPNYREKYNDILSLDFPRLPLTSNVALFRQLCGLGEELVALHLLEASVLNKPITKFKGKGDNVVEKGYPKYQDGVVLINPSQGFEGVPEDVWEFHIGGYQVCEKWLKDRRGRELSQEDITHYQKVVVALKETIRLMGEVDRVIDVHGGWPIK